MRISFSASHIYVRYLQTMPEGVISLAGLPALLPAPAAATHETHGKGILVVACTLGPLTFGLVGARLWARVAIQRNAGLDDWLLLAAMVSAGREYPAALYQNHPLIFFPRFLFLVF